MDALNIQAMSYPSMELESRVKNISYRTTSEEDSGDGPSEVKKACKDMESLFIFYILKEMRATIPKTGYFDGGKGEEMYTSMFDAQLAKELAAERGMGLSPLLYESLMGRTDKNK